jgi:hypothetical protein
LRSIARGVASTAIALLAGCLDFDDLRSRGDGGTGFCGTQCLGPSVACFCSDFDAFATVDEGWEGSTNGGGAYAFFVEDVRSAPRSALMTCPGSTTGVIGSAFTVFKRSFQTTARTIRLEGAWKLRAYDRSTFGNFEFWSVAIGSSTRVSLGEAFDMGTTGWRIGNVYNDDLGQPVSEVYPLTTNPPPTDLDRWVRFALEVTFADDATGSIRLLWNGVEALHVTGIRTMSPDDDLAATLSASIGGGTLQGMTPELWMLFDDVVVTVE